MALKRLTQGIVAEKVIFFELVVLLVKDLRHIRLLQLEMNK